MRWVAAIGLGLALGCATGRPYPADALEVLTSSPSVWLPPAPLQGPAPRVEGPAADAARFVDGFGDAGVRTSFDIEALALSSDGEIVAVAGREKARVFARGTSTKLDLPDVRHVQRIAVSPTGDRLALESHGGEVWLVVVETGEVRKLRKWARPDVRRAGLTIGFSEDGAILHAGRRLWSADSGEPVALPGDAEEVLWMSPDTERLLVADLRVSGRAELVPGHFEAAGYERYETVYDYDASGYAVHSRSEAAPQPVAVGGYPKHLVARTGGILLATRGHPKLVMFAPADKGVPVEFELDSRIFGLDLAADAKHAAAWTRTQLQVWPTRAPHDVIAQFESHEIAGAFVGGDALVVHGEDVRVVDVSTGAVRYVDPGTRPRTYIHQIAVAPVPPRFGYLRSATHVLRPADLDVPAPAAQGSEIVDIAVAADGRLASIAEDGSVWQWRPDGSGMPLENGDWNVPQPGDGFAVANMAQQVVRFAEQGDSIVAFVDDYTGHADGLSRVWDSETGKARHQLRGRYGTLLPDGDVILEIDSLGYGRTRWTPAGKRAGRLSRWEHRGKFVPLDDAVFTRDGTTAYVIAFDRAKVGWFIQVRDVETGRATGRLPTTAGSPWSLQLSDDENALLVFSADDVRVVDLAANEVVWRRALADDPARLAALSPAGDVVAIGRDDGTIALWTEGKLAATIDLSHRDETASALRWANDTLHVGTRRGLLLRFDIDRSSLRALGTASPD